MSTILRRTDMVHPVNKFRVEITTISRLTRMRARRVFHVAVDGGREFEPPTRLHSFGPYFDLTTATEKHRELEEEYDHRKGFIDLSEAERREKIDVWAEDKPKPPKPSLRKISIGEL